MPCFVCPCLCRPPLITLTATSSASPRPACDPLCACRDALFTCVAGEREHVCVRVCGCVRMGVLCGYHGCVCLVFLSRLSHLIGSVSLPFFLVISLTHSLCRTPLPSRYFLARFHLRVFAFLFKLHRVHACVHVRVRLCACGLPSPAFLSLSSSSSSLAFCSTPQAWRTRF